VGLCPIRPNCGLEIVFVIRVTARQLAAHDYFVVHGYSTKGASAILGNGVGESGQDLDSTFDRPHADHESGGFLEWRDSQGSPRKTRLAAFADARGPGLRDDLFTQCDYAIWELGKFFPTLDQQLRTPGTRSIANLTANFCWQFENPAAATAGLDNRITHAEAVAARAAEIWKAAHEPQPSPPAPLPQPPLPQPPPAIPPTPTAPAGPPISASMAGRRAAVRDNIGALRDALVQERDAIDAEIALLDATLADFGKLEALMAPAALPKPVVEPNLIPQTKRIAMNPRILATLQST
jgi:Phage tail lysozyme